MSPDKRSTEFAVDPATLKAIQKLLPSEHVDEENIEHAILYAKRNIETHIEKANVFRGEWTNPIVRKIRQKRRKFMSKIQAGDYVSASEIYRSLWEGYYSSASFLILFSKGFDDENIDSVIKQATWDLKGLVEFEMYSDLKPKYKHLIQNRHPTIDEVVEFYDIIYSRSRTEFVYVDWYVKQITRNYESNMKNEMEEQMEMFFERLDPNKMKRFGQNLLSKQEITDFETNVGLINLRPQLLILWLENVATMQRLKTRMFLVSTFFQEFMVKVVDGLPEKVRPGIKKLLMLNYNGYVIDRHLEKVESVLLSNQTVRFAVFLETLSLGTSESQDQYLETFARISSAMPVWKELKLNVNEQTKDLGDNFKILLDKMSEAEKKASYLGYISHNSDISRLDFLTGFGIRATAVGVPYLYFDEVYAWTSSLVTYLESMF